MAATMFYVPRERVLDANGNAIAGAKLFFYAAGTSTPQNTFSDPNLTSANANPVVADSGGLFGPIYLLPSAYKVILKTAADVEVWTQDNYAATGSLIDNGLAEGRLTLVSGSPDSVTTVTGAGTIYWSPYQGNRLALYDGSTWQIRTFSEIAISLGGLTTGKNYDLFAYDNAGVVAFDAPLVWTNDTTRATGIAFQDGVYVKAGNATRRYIGTFRTSGTGVTEESPTKRFVWNAQNRLARPVKATTAVATWTYSTNVWRQANADTALKVEVVNGGITDLVSLRVSAVFQNTNNGIEGAVAIGIDSTTNPTVPIGYAVAYNANLVTQIHTALNLTPLLGYHYYVWLEYSGPVATTTWSGTGSLLEAVGITGFVWG